MTDQSSKLNGHHAKNRDVSSILEEWLFLVEEDSGVLARCTDIGLNVELWTYADRPQHIKGKKIIVVGNHVGDMRKEEFEVIGRVRAGEPMTFRHWKPFMLGDDRYPTLKALSASYSLADLLWADKPWTYETPPVMADRRPGWPCTDYGNAERMASRYGGVIRYCKPWKSYLWWNGQRWSVDDIGKVNVLAKQTMRKILEEAAGAYDQDERIALAKWAIKCESVQRVEALLKLFWSEPRIPILPAALDADPWLFNCPNGTINLKNGALIDHDRSHMITRMSPVEFEPEAECPIWEDTINRIFGCDDDLIGFVQRLFGICLTGDVSEQILPIFYGEGGNGKSTILNALIDIMGPDYAIMAPPGLLFAKSGQNHPTAQASLFGMRSVIDMESAEGARLNEALVKQLTGSDRISARRMNENFWTFKPTHKLILCTNSQPTIQETKNAIWRRLKLVPFVVEIPESEQQSDLPQKLRAEYEGILAWCVRGCLDWVYKGLRTPDVIKLATAEYRAEEDTLAGFLSELCVCLDGARVKADVLYRKYRAYMEAAGLVQLSQTGFGRSMKKRGFEKLKSSGNWYLGIGLRSEEIDDARTSY